ncbi:hypothetical protein [Spiroplasma endosymbiont of Polydrusus cervinus]|uniref:hypothetical protein n=1 Tax=Spiroplasma endosymbiont of Polydrusus cervinus TaxID=3066287 RepID=UPI0030D2AD40
MFANKIRIILIIWFIFIQLISLIKIANKPMPIFQHNDPTVKPHNNKSDRKCPINPINKYQYQFKINTLIKMGIKNNGIDILEIICIRITCDNTTIIAIKIAT